MMDALRFALVLATLYAAHSVADHWIQTNGQAVTKGQCEHGRATRAGLLALAGHVLTHTATLAVVLAVIAIRFPGLDWSPAAMAAGLVVNAASHAWADHRPNLRKLAHAVGKGSYYESPGGAYQLDQAWHL
ncbi:DUF3307 domain-containing protein, partial [Microtetraspora sp. AC03309]|uniref:DUF3307 domain-containing protein n=1 Tax=Microtetraspora sp. AC03309 TaxID=2779376 RepID=UPI001E2A1E02